ncbi:hypothetical protein GCM10010327_24330 [Streptomyces nitrosporeus]|nr:hypothetical protein GCM10010327_24330 [Streptomyces nitrosporeus]
MERSRNVPASAATERPPRTHTDAGPVVTESPSVTTGPVSCTVRRALPRDLVPPWSPGLPSCAPVTSGYGARSAAPCRRSGRRAFSVSPTLPPARAGAHPLPYSSAGLSRGTQNGAPVLTRAPSRLATITSVSVLPLVFTSGWASGINAYAVILLLGVSGAAGLSDEVPEALQRTDVLVVAGVLFLCEVVADKIPYVDSVWDAVHTVVRPLSGAVVAALLAGGSGSLPELAAAAVGGSTALVSHLVKAGTRMAVNTSPEPFSNIGVSVAEDLGVAAVIVFAVFHPVAAAVVAGALLLAGIAVVVLLASRIRRFLRRRARRREARRPAGTAGYRPPG